MQWVGTTMRLIQWGQGVVSIEFCRQLMRGSPWQSLSIMRLLDIDGSVDWTDRRIGLMIEGKGMVMPTSEQ